MRMVKLEDIFTVAVSGDEVAVEIDTISVRGKKDRPTGHLGWKASEDDGTGELTKNGSRLLIGVAGEPVEMEVTSINLKGKLGDLKGTFGLKATDDEGQQALPGMEPEEEE